jgi:hypothetical protein
LEKIHHRDTEIHRDAEKDEMRTGLLPERGETVALISNNK